MNENLYKVKVQTTNRDPVEFGFNKMSDALQFASTCVETIDGMEDGNAYVTIFHTKKED